MTEVHLKLSEILQSGPQFSFYQELIKLKHLDPSGTSGAYDLVQVLNTIEGIIHYLDEVRDICLETVEYCKTAGLSLNTRYLLWLYEGRDELADLVRNIGLVDLVVSQLVLLLALRVQPEAGTTTDGGVVSPTLDPTPGFTPSEEFYAEMVNQAELIGEVSIDISTQLLKSFSQDMPLAVAFHDLLHNGLGSLKTEIRECFTVYFHLAEARSPSPASFPALTVVTHRLLSMFPEACGANRSLTALSETSMSLPVGPPPSFNTSDASFYSEYQALCQRLEPLNAAVQAIPERIETFTHASKPHYVDLVTTLNGKLAGLIDNWNLLNEDMHILEATTVSTRWLDLYQYLIDEGDASTVAIDAAMEGEPSSISPTIREQAATLRMAGLVVQELYHRVPVLLPMALAHHTARWIATVGAFERWALPLPNESKDPSGSGLRSFRMRSKSVLQLAENTPEASQGAFNSLDLVCAEAASPPLQPHRNKNRRSWMLIQPVLIEDSSPTAISRFFPAEEADTSGESLGRHALDPSPSMETLTNRMSGLFLSPNTSRDFETNLIPISESSTAMEPVLLLPKAVPLTILSPVLSPVLSLLMTPPRASLSPIRQSPVREAPLARYASRIPILRPTLTPIAVTIKSGGDQASRLPLPRHTIIRRSSLRHPPSTSLDGHAL